MKIKLDLKGLLQNEKVAERVFYASLGFAVGCIGTSIGVTYLMKKDLNGIQIVSDKRIENIMRNAGDRVGVVRNVFKELAVMRGTPGVTQEEYLKAVEEKFDFLDMLFDQPFLDLEDLEGTG